jgi:hypothetical protein
VCGDGYCAGPESAASCPQDCASCGDGSCNGGETPATCPGDCPAGCGNGACDAGETAANCATDCLTPCGDGACTPSLGESCASCQTDCGFCPSEDDALACADGTDNDADGDTDCADADCSAFCASCGDATCDSDTGEACDTCPADCGQCCGDGTCDPGAGEACDTCPADCGACCGGAAPDVSYTFTNNTSSVAPEYYGQSFTPTVTGSVTRIDVLDILDTSGLAFATLELYDLGVCVVTPCGSLQYATSVAFATGDNFITLPTPFPVTAGLVYTWRLYSGSGISANIDDTGAYPGGQSLFYSGYDVPFVIWVDPCP